jgi:hypothetical protein
MRKRHGLTLKYPDVQASTATMNKHRHSRCHYKRNTGSTPAGMNNLHIGGSVGRQTLGGSPPTTIAAAMTLGQTLLRQGPRPRPHTRGEDNPRNGGRPSLHRHVPTQVLVDVQTPTSAWRRRAGVRTRQSKNTNATLAACDVLDGPPVRTAQQPPVWRTDSHAPPQRWEVAPEAAPEAAEPARQTRWS